MNNCELGGLGARLCSAAERFTGLCQPEFSSPATTSSPQFSTRAQCQAEDPWEDVAWELVGSVLKHLPSFGPCMVGSCRASVGLATGYLKHGASPVGLFPSPVEKLPCWEASPVEISENKVMNSSTDSLSAERSSAKTKIWLSFMTLWPQVLL